MHAATSETLYTLRDFKSPFRYPGGKSWLIPTIVDWLDKLPTRPRVFAEPFAGGAIASIVVANEGRADHVYLNELDAAVYATWRVILSPEADALATAIEVFPFSEQAVRDCLAEKPSNDLALAFQTILRNRCARGGVIAPRAGLIRVGDRGRGMNARWYPETLARRIRALRTLYCIIEPMNDDALSLLQDGLVKRHDVALFLDPPYSLGDESPGDRLYRHHELDHERLFYLLALGNAPFLLTYHDHPRVRALAERWGFDVREVQGPSNAKRRSPELVITRGERDDMEGNA